MARKKKLSTEELSNNRKDLIGQWNAIVKQVEEIEEFVVTSKGLD